MNNFLSLKFFKDNRKYVLKDNKDRSSFFGELSIYIKILIGKLWNDPKLISNILLNSSAEDVKYSLANFFVNNFYENIFSSNSIENNLLYLIALILKEEINNILNKEKPEDFLNSSICGYILEQLRDKKDIKLYFRTMVYNIFEKLNDFFSTDEIVFNLKKNKENKTKSFHNNTVFNPIENLGNIDEDYSNEINIDYMENNLEQGKNKENDKHELFKSKNIKPLKEEDLNQYLSEYEKKTDKTNMNIFINNIKENVKASPHLYNTKILSKNFINKERMNIYEDNYYKISQLFDFILEDLLSNLHLLPYSIKCICKIISKLIQNKFSDIDLIKKNAFIAKFFFHILFSNMLNYPSNLLLINDFYLIKTHQKNAITIATILKKFTLGQLFKDDDIEGNFTIFNWMIIQKMPRLIEIFDSITNVKLPIFIEKLIDGNLNEDYKYNYFEENKNEVMIYKSICFSVDEIYFLVNNIRNSKEKIFQNIIDNEMKKIIEKLLIKDNFEKLEQLKGINEENIKKEIDNNSMTTDINSVAHNMEHLTKKEFHNSELMYFLITEYDINNKYVNTNDKNKSREYFNLPIKKEKELTEEEKMKNIINRTKNFLCAILYNYKSLNKDDFLEGKCSTISSTLKEIQKYMKSLNILIDGSIPSDWYIQSLLKYFEILPKELLNNDCEELLRQIECDINTSINNLNYQDISIYYDKLKTLKDLNKYYNNELMLLDEIIINGNANTFVNKMEFAIEMHFIKKENLFNMTVVNHKKPNKKLNKENKRICYNIEDFINKIPDFARIEEARKINIYKLLKEIKFPTKIQKFIIFIHKKILNEINDENKSNRIVIKIYDYIMEKIYTKIFPKNIEVEDALIELNCNKASWVEPKHLIKGKDDFIYGNFISDITEWIKKIDQQKSISKKFICIEEIFRALYNLFLFNGDKLEGLDEEIQFLDYGLIKAKPKNLYTNCEFLKTFIGNRKGKKEDNHLTQISLISSMIAKLNHSFFINISESEFKEKCEKNIKNIVLNNSKIK